MMKIAIKKHILENMLSSLQPYLEKRDNSQITSHILLNANDSTLTLQSTDYEVGLRLTSSTLTVQENGLATANGKKFLEIIRNLKDEEITLETTEDTLLVKQKKSIFRLPMFDATMFPSFPNHTTLPKIELDSTKLINSFKKITPAIDSNNPKMELNGALIDINEHFINIVSTDTRRLALVELSMPSTTALSLILPKKAIQEIQKLFFAEIEIHYDETNLIIVSEGHYFFTKLINGKYPDYQRILPKQIKHPITLPKDVMVEAIRQVTSISTDVRMILTTQAIRFESVGDGTMNAQTEIEIQTNLPYEMSIGINSRYILDFLASIETREFTLGINEPHLPFELRSDNFITIVMPTIL